MEPLIYLIVALCFLVLLALLETKTKEVAVAELGWDMYVINLDRAQKRLDSFLQMLSTTDLSGQPVIRLKAIDGHVLNLEDYVTDAALREILDAERLGYRQRHYELTRGAVGCYLSHMNAWHRMLESDQQSIMICEDDAVLSKNIRADLNSCLKTIPNAWDILLLGYWCVQCNRHAGWRNMHRFFGLHCYLIKREAVTKIESYCGTRIGQQLDSMLSDMCMEGRLVVYGVEEKLAMQAGSGSTVQMPMKSKSGVDPWMALPAVRALRLLSAS